MKILMLGDVTDARSCEYLCEKLPAFRRACGADLVTVNVENASFIAGASPDQANALLLAGADVLTGGNHTLQCYAIHAYLENSDKMLRPLNFPAEAPGVGYCIADACGYRVLVMNALGTVQMTPSADNPFGAIDRVLARMEGAYDLAVLDFHAEATGEKLAMGHYLDGRVSVIAGTHTHVPTADACILPKGSGYVTDLGMCGVKDSILGISRDVIIRRMAFLMPARYEQAEGDVEAQGVLFTLDPTSRRVSACERVSF